MTLVHNGKTLQGRVNGVSEEDIAIGEMELVLFYVIFSHLK